MLKQYLNVVEDDMATVGHVVLIEFGYIVLILSVVGGTATVTDIKPLLMSHVGRRYTKVTDEITTTA